MTGDEFNHDTDEHVTPPKRRARRAGVVGALLGDRDGDRKLRRLATMVTLTAGAIALLNVSWRGVSAVVTLALNVNQLVGTVERADTTMNSLNLRVTLLSARFDTLNAQQRRSEVRDSAQFAALTHAAVKRVTTAIKQAMP